MHKDLSLADFNLAHNRDYNAAINANKIAMSSIVTAYRESSSDFVATWHSETSLCAVIN